MNTTSASVAVPTKSSGTSTGDRVAAQLILPGDRPTRIDVGAQEDCTAADGTVWLTDRGFNDGQTVDRGDVNVTGTNDPALFRTERNGMVDYTFAIPNGVYTVNLHLAETDPAVTAAGQRIFNLDVNGWPIPSVDIFAEAKSNNIAIIKSVMVEVTNGTLTIRFMQRKLRAKLDALEIIPEPGKPAPPKPASRIVGRRLPAHTLPCARHFILEDFENTTDADLHKKWNQWGELSYWLDPDSKNSGQYGVTHQVGRVNTSWFAYPPRLPEFSCAGMNAWRMWVKPDGSGRFATFFIKDGSQEVYCWLLPDLLIGTEPSGHRNLVYADGTPALLVADTPWALSWRATHEQCEIYAQDRQSKGFNAALLMSVQPDRNAHGPRSRTEHDGFDIGFEDLPDGHINQINIAYFQYLDRLAEILVSHEIVPVWQPVFHGYGWKGLAVAGPVIPPLEYARYCRYLVARYGAQPAIWLVAADGDGAAPGVDPGGWEIERWDAYQHPTGIHYAPHHHPWANQDRPWLDFQWCQTGHNGEHVPQRVAVMWEKRPVKAVANGEPTYEHIGEPGRAAGWWQGHEAWSNLTAGGTMDVVYGAGSLWQWRLDTQEEHQQWCMARHAGWREALDFEGSRYVGILSHIFEGLPFGGMEPDYHHTYGRAGLFVPDKLLVVYLPDGGGLALADTEGVPPRYRVIDPKNGAILMSPSNLRCEYLENPLGLDEAQPRLSWEVCDDRRGAVQMAYHILVAGSSEALDNDTCEQPSPSPRQSRTPGSMSLHWDSTRPMSTASESATYALRPDGPTMPNECNTRPTMSPRFCISVPMHWAPYWAMAGTAATGLTLTVRCTAIVPGSWRGWRSSVSLVNSSRS